MSDIPPPPPPPPPSGPSPAGGPAGSPVSAEYAGWFSRVLAYIIDVLPVAVLNGIGWLLAGPTTTTVVGDNGVAITTTSGLGLLYWVMWGLGIAWFVYNKGYLEGTTGQSIGKKVLDMRTVGQMTGEPLGFGLAFGRLLLLWVDFAICYIGVLWPLWDKNRQCLVSDKVTNAVVTKG